MQAALDSILEVLKPETFWDYFAYAILLFSVITLAVLPDGNTQGTYLMLATAFFSIFDIIRDGLSTGGALFGDKGFATLIIHVMMAVFPFITAGVIRGKPKEKGRALPVAIITGIISMVYTIGFQLLVTGQ